MKGENSKPDSLPVAAFKVLLTIGFAYFVCQLLAGGIQAAVTFLPRF